MGRSDRIWQAMPLRNAPDVPPALQGVSDGRSERQGSGARPRFDEGYPCDSACEIDSERHSPEGPGNRIGKRKSSFGGNVVSQAPKTHASNGLPKTSTTRLYNP